jgi:hypothetical protein
MLKPDPENSVPSFIMYRSEASSSPFIIFLELFLSVTESSRQLDTISLTDDLNGYVLGFLKHAEHDRL